MWEAQNGNVVGTDSGAECPQVEDKSGGLGGGTEEDPGPRPWIKRPRDADLLLNKNMIGQRAWVLD